MVPLLANLPSSCRALALGGAAIGALGTLGRACGQGEQPAEDGGARALQREWLVAVSGNFV